VVTADDELWFEEELWFDDDEEEVEPVELEESSAVVEFAVVAVSD
jgi:hypothetical protein